VEGHEEHEVYDGVPAQAPLCATAVHPGQPQEPLVARHCAQVLAVAVPEHVPPPPSPESPPEPELDPTPLDEPPEPLPGPVHVPS
jgi:hypothetical protein